ncbi:MAG TPA: aminotransferase class III-fold pyridoxal phosphate-dependent enzyme [Candidatus Krumholzibacteria bacterium]|nr:aminotransferase class III-fold pyridoxal phosphate-dependent enzyme [Candidatus Krumholzibacteria bacterium]
MDQVIWYPGHQLLLANIVRAEGPWVVADDGRRWLDLESGVWAASVGQTHPRVDAALQQQFATIAHTGFNYTAPVVAEAAAAVLRVLDLGDGARCSLLCSGSEAVEYCIRIVTGMLPRPRLLTMADSYFGAYGAAHGRPADRWTTFDWFGCEGCPDGKRCDATCERFATIPLAEIGAFVFEPGSSSGFVRFPPAKLVEAIAQAVQAAGGFVVVNEVTTGVGRTGRWFGYRHYDVQPDAVALGKGIGGGYPVAVAAVGPRVAAGMSGPPAYAQSHQNDPLGAAVLLAVIGIIEDDDLIARGAAVGARLAEGLMALAQTSPRIRTVRARGPMIAIDLDMTPAEAAALHRALVDAGYLVGLRPGTATLRLDPPLGLADQHADAFLQVFGERLRAV